MSGNATQRMAIREGELLTLKDGTTVKLLETAQEVRQFMPEFSGPAARIEVTPNREISADIHRVEKFP